MVGLQDIREAAGRIRGICRKTPIIEAEYIGQGIYIKPEILQNTGSFKLRGAANKIARLPEAELAGGVIACSAGNHAQGVALAAQRRGIRSVICMPAGAPLSKVVQTRSYGAQVELCPGVFDDTYARAREIAAREGLTFIHPFDDDDIIAGQGTVGLEIAEEMPEVEVVLVPVGGGGLISGAATAIKSLCPGCRVIGVEAAGAASMLLSRRAGAVSSLPGVNTIADGIAVKTPGARTFEICEKYVDDIVTVRESEIASAMLLLLERGKIVVEGAGAVPIAAILSGHVNVEGKRTVCVASGGNVDANILSQIIRKGLEKTGRITSFTVELSDKPHQLSAVLAVISNLGVNILTIDHDRDSPNTDVQRCFVRFRVETRDAAHGQQLVDALREAGYEPVETR